MKDFVAGVHRMGTPIGSGLRQTGVTARRIVSYTHGQNHQTRDKVKRYYSGSEVPMRVIRKFAGEVAGRFKPDKIILFGSYAYGTPHEDSDVDILVVMACRNQIDAALRIHDAIEPPFPLQLIVRTPYNLGWRLAERESFHTEIVTRGKLLYEKSHSGVGAKSR
jgi:predicted nucleotidyltransferase